MGDDLGGLDIILPIKRNLKRGCNQVGGKNEKDEKKGQRAKSARIGKAPEPQHVASAGNGSSSSVDFKGAVKSGGSSCPKCTFLNCPEATACLMCHASLRSKNPTHRLEDETPSDYVKRRPPSQFSQDDWYWIHSPEEKEKREGNGCEMSINEAIELLHALWDSLDERNKTLENLWKISDDNRFAKILSGKWMMFVKTPDVDRVWAVIVHGVVSGRLGCTAKVGPKSSAHPCETHLICVYTDDFRDKDDVDRVLKELRRLGFEAGMSYKADVATYLGIYRNNPWGISPNFYYARKHACVCQRRKDKAKQQKNTIEKYTRKAARR